MSILTVENLGFTYAGNVKPVLRAVNAAFEPGKMYAITGPSGSGKSTLLSLLAGMETPTEGQILLDDENTTAIMLLLREQVAEKGFCVIIVTHDPTVNRDGPG